METFKFSNKQAAIAEREKSILFLHRNFICVHNVFVSGERRNKHNQRTFRQVEVSDKPVEHLKFKAGINKNACVIIVFTYFSELCGNSCLLYTSDAADE